MALVYRAPGVSVDEIVSPTISPLLASPTSVCLIGVVSGTITRTDQVVLNGTTATPLPGLPQQSTLGNITGVIDVLDPTKGAADGSGYTLTTDYTVQGSAGTITRVANGAIADGRTVSVTYSYLPADYYEPIRISSLSAIEQRFGSSYNAAGTAINSVVSYAAGVAFENGAADVVIQPLFIRATPGDTTTAKTQPTSTQAASTAAWNDTLAALRDYEDINVIVPVIGQSAPNVGDSALLSIFEVIQDHIQFMKTQDLFLVGIFGEDSSAANTVAQPQTIRNHAATLAGRYGGDAAQQSVLVSAAKLARPLPSQSTALNIGGQYAAAAVAGMLAGRDISASLTRQILAGFTALTDFPQPTKADKNLMAQNGVLVVEHRNGLIQIRHAITLDNTNAATQELSVVRAKHYMIESVRTTLESNIIGQIPADGNAPLIVQTAISGVLEQLRQNRTIVDYSNVETRASNLNPTVVEARFSYRPAFPLNYVEITFSVDLSGDVVPTSESTPSS